MRCQHKTIREKESASWFGKARLKKAAAIVLCTALLANTVPLDARAAYDAALFSAEEQPDKEAVPDEISGGQIQYNSTSVSMSDPGLMPGIMMYAPSKASTDEKLNLDMQWPQGYDYNSGTLTLASGEMSFKIMPGLSGTTVQEPVLEIHIPSCMEVTDYPDQTTDALAPYLAPSNPVSKRTDSSGTVLTYRFISKLAWASFNINARIPRGSQVNDNKTYSIRLNYYDGTPSNPVMQKEVTFTTKKDVPPEPELGPGSVYLDSPAMSESRTLEENTSTYDVGPYSWSIRSSGRHLPYESLKMIVPLPPGALPVFSDGYSRTPFANGETKTISSYRVTYQSSYSYRSENGNVSGSAGVLIYELTAGAGFLTSGNYFTFGSYPDNIYLRFTDPKAGTCQSAASPRIECVVGGKTIVMRDYDTTSYLTRVEFKERSPWTMVRPNEAWKDTIFLKEGVTVYDTAIYRRGVYAVPTAHVSYDSLKMTVLLPEGALPGTGRGEAFASLPEDQPYNNGSYQVTYCPNYRYSNADGSASGTAPALVYEIKSPESFLSSASNSDTFYFSGNQSLYLRFTDPKAGVYRSPASPKVEVTRNGSTTTTYDFDPSPQHSYYTAVTFLQPSEADLVYPDYDEKNGRGWSDTIAMEEGKTVYDTKLYDRTVYSRTSSVPHYPYDQVRMIVLLPDEAVPGFGTGDTFAPLNNGETYTRTTYYSQTINIWKVTYQEQYPYANADKTVSGTAKALIYELSSDYSKTSFLTGSSLKDLFTFRTYQENSGLHLRFTDPKPGTYHSAASPKVEYMMDGKWYQAPGYFSQTDADTSVTFKSPEIDWAKLLLTADANETPLGLGNFIVLPENYQNNKEYYGYITNNTGYTLKDVKVSYIFDDDLNTDKLALDLGGSGGPANALVVYTTRLDTAEKTVRMNASNNVLSLERGDAFLTADITYDTLESASDPRKMLTASLHNYERKDGLRYVKAYLKSANSDLSSSEGHTLGSLITRFYPVSTYTYLRAATTIKVPEGNKPNELNKGDNFNVVITTSSTQVVGKFQNLTLYLLMPKGYMLTDYTPPAECRDGEYRSTSRTLKNGDILYCLEYTDDIMYSGGQHVFSFYVSMEADTSSLQNIMIPKEVFAAVDRDALFQFNPSSYSHYYDTVLPEEEIGWDVTGDGTMEDRLYVMKGVNVTVNKMEVINIEGFIATQGQVGMWHNREYTCNSTGNSHLVIFNGIGSGASMTNGSFSIALRKKGDTFNYKDTAYTSQYDVLLTGPVKPQGEFLEGCSVQYSPDGNSWLSGDQVEDFTKISYVQIRSAQGCVLRTGESAYIDFPFAVHFSDNMGAEKAYIDTQMQYTLDTSTDPVPAHVFSTLTAKPINFSGTVYQDRNYNGEQDANESTNDKVFILQLYSGEGTDGTLLQEISTDAASGRYDFDILLPGTYTLHVAKDDNEIYGGSDHFDDNGNYTFTLDWDVPAPVTRKLNMGIMMQGILEKPEFVISPDVPDGREGWYVTLPQVALLPMVPPADADTVDTMFRRGTEAEQKLTPETMPYADGTGSFSFRAYNKKLSETGICIATSDTAALEFKVDVDAPVLGKDFSYSISDMSGRSSIGNFLSFGNFFNKAIQITITAEDVGSGIETLYYTLPDEETRSVKPDGDGYFHFEVPMDTAGKITYYVEDKAGNRSNIVTLRKGEGSEIWIIEDKAPVWKDFVLSDTDGNPGSRGADGNTWFAGAVKVSTLVSDEGSGLANVTSRINEGSPETRNLTGSEKVTSFELIATVESEGINLLWAEAEDNAANVSETQISFGIDTTPPVIALEEKTFALTPDEGALVPTAEEETPSDDSYTATLLVLDTGSGIDPDSIQVIWQEKEAEFQTTPVENGYRLTCSLAEMAYTDKEATLLITAKDYTGWSKEFSVTRYQEPIIYVAADTGSDVTGDGSRTYPVQTLGAAFERVTPGGMVVLLENYNGTAYVSLEVTLDLNGKTLHADVPGSAIAIGSSGRLTIIDSNGLASAAEGYGRDPASEGEVFGGLPGDTAFTLDQGALCLADGTIYCGYTGTGNIEIMDDARMMYLLTYLNGGGTGVPPGLHYIEENTSDALKQNTFSREGYTFQGWLYEDHLYEPGQNILMPGRNMETLAKWAKISIDLKITGTDPEPAEERGPLDQVPKTGRGESSHSNTAQPDRMELYIKIRKKEDEQNTED